MNTTFIKVFFLCLVFVILVSCLTRTEQFVSHTTLENIPVFYINLDSDKKKRMLETKEVFWQGKPKCEGKKKKKKKKAT